MKKPDTKTLIKTLKLGINLVWYYLLFMTAVNIFILLAIALLGETFIAPWAEFWGRPRDLISLYSLGIAIFLYEQPVASIERELWLTLSAATTTYYIARLLIVYQLKKVFETSIEESPFSRKNINRIRIIGAAYALAPLIVNFMFYLLGKAVSPALQVENMATRAYYAIDYNSLFIGATIALLAEAFRIGAKIKEDQDLTI